MWSGPKAGPSTSFAERLPWFVEQCRVFQRVRKTWSAAEPCCLANGFTRPITPPTGDGTACYERLDREQRQLFKSYVESAEANGCIQPTGFNAHFLQLLHPELHTAPPASSPSLPALQMARPRWRSRCGWLAAPGAGGREAGASRRPEEPPRSSAGAPAPAQPSEEAPEAAQPRRRNVRAKARPKGAPQGAAKRAKASKLRRRRSGVRKKVPKASRQSGIPGVCWREDKKAWSALWREERKQNSRDFCVRRYMDTHGVSFDEAEAQALQDAIAFRATLERNGLVRAAHAIPCQTKVTGVHWTRGKWEVRINVGEKRRLNGGSFRPKDESREEVERARQSALERKRELERQHRQSELRKAPPDRFEEKTKEKENKPRKKMLMRIKKARNTKKWVSGVTGVTWNPSRQYWCASVTVEGKNFRKQFSALDGSDESVGAALQKAVHFRKDLERQFGDLIRGPGRRPKPKGPPQPPVEE